MSGAAARAAARRAPRRLPRGSAAGQAQAAELLHRARLFLARPAVRNAGVNAGKALAAAAAATAGLVVGVHETKRSLNTELPEDIWKQAALRIPEGASPVFTTPAIAEEAVVRVAAAGGFSPHAFRVAARHLRPVELELEELHAQLDGEPPGPVWDVAEAELAARWRERGYLSDRAGAPPQVFGRRLTSDAQGNDIGSQVPTYLSKPEPGMPGVPPLPWRAEDREHAAEALERWGCCLVRGCMSPESVENVRKEFGLGAGFEGRRATDVGQWLLARDPNVSMGRYTFGRLHCVLRGSPALELHCSSVHSAVAPLVHEAFRRSSTAENEGERIFLSEAQLVITEPWAEAQRWHLDKVGRMGLTVLVPLRHIGSNRGSQQLLPGSHHISDTARPLMQRLRKSFSALAASHGAVEVTAAGGLPDHDWQAGEALLLDSRVLHRGLQNDSLGAPVPMLILRYDFADSTPPGCSRHWLRLMAHFGSSLDRCFRFYAAV